MGLKVYSFSVGASFVFVQLLLLASSYECHRPQIMSEYETIIEVGDNFTVLCQGNTPLTWSWPKVENVYRNWTTVKVTDAIPKENIYKYASRLFVENATFVYTGFYSCFDRDINSPDDDEMAKIYLYVKDDEHLSVVDEDVYTLVATQYNDINIPCRPTSPDVIVELTLITGEQVPIDVIHEDDTIYRYHPHYGFITNHTRTPTLELYTCSFAKDSKETELTIIVDIELMTDSLAKPLLEEMSGGHSIVGDKLQLDCKVRAATVVSFSWMTPTGAPDLSRMELSPIRRSSNDSSITYQKLVVKRITLNDSGVYFCNVSDNQNHHSVASLNVKIYDSVNLTAEKEGNTSSAFLDVPDKSAVHRETEDFYSLNKPAVKVI